MSVEKFYIPRHLDDAPRFLFWSIDEAISAIIPFMCGLMFNLKLFTLVIAIISFKGWKKIKGAGGGAAIRAMIYWYYPNQILGTKSLPDSSTKIFIA